MIPHLVTNLMAAGARQSELLKKRTKPALFGHRYSRCAPRKLVANKLWSDFLEGRLFAHYEEFNDKSNGSCFSSIKLQFLKIDKIRTARR